MLDAVEGASPRECWSLRTPRSAKSNPYRFVRAVKAFRAE